MFLFLACGVLIVAILYFGRGVLIPVALAVFFSFLLANRFHVAPNLPGAFYVTLFFLVLAGALVFCAGVLWAAKMTLTRKVGLTVFTSLGLLLQFGIVAVILRAILITITAYPQ